MPRWYKNTCTVFLVVISLCSWSVAVIQGPYPGRCHLGDTRKFLPIGGPGVKWTDTLQKQAEDWCSMQRGCYGFFRLDLDNPYINPSCMIFCGQAVMCQEAVNDVYMNQDDWIVFIKQLPKRLSSGLYSFEHGGTKIQHCWPDAFTTQVCCAVGMAWCWMGNYTADTCCDNDPDMVSSMEKYHPGHGCAPVYVEGVGNGKNDGSIQFTPDMFPLRAEQGNASSDGDLPFFIAQWADIFTACPGAALRIALDEGWDSQRARHVAGNALLFERLQLEDFWVWEVPYISALRQNIPKQQEMRSLAAKRDMLPCHAIDHFSGRQSAEISLGSFSLEFFAPTIVPTAAGGEIVTFSFGQNWVQFLQAMEEHPEQLHSACESVISLLGEFSQPGGRVLDIGSGSGIHSACLWETEPSMLLSIDVDSRAIEATEVVKKVCSQSSVNWQVAHGSILNKSFTGNLGKFDVVYSWGVLHHTGFMWSALQEAVDLCEIVCTVVIALYTDTGRHLEYEEDLALKRQFNCGDSEEKLSLLNAWVNLDGGWEAVLGWQLEGFRGRGMSRFWNILDWLGGLPYEVATPDEVVSFFQLRGFSLVRSELRGRQMNSEYVFRRSHL